MDAKTFKQMLKTLSYPGGKDAKVYEKSFYAHWHKRHGHGGARVLARVAEAAKKAGFVYGTCNVNTDAVGDRLARGNEMVLVTPEGTWQLDLNSFYGQTAWENSFTCKVGFKPVKQ